MMIQTKNTNEVKKERGQRVKEIRLMTGLTQKEFARELRMSREGYQKLECGYNNVSLDVLEGLKRVYGVSSDYLLYGELQKEEKIWEQLENCSEATRLDVLLRLVEYFSAADKGLFKREDGQGELLGLRETLMQDRQRS